MAVQGFEAASGEDRTTPVSPDGHAGRSLAIDRGRGVDPSSGREGAAGSVRIVMIGRCAVLDPDGRPVRLTPAQRQALAVLVAAGPAGIEIDRLADELWSGQPPGGWRPALRMALSRLRRTVGPIDIETSGGTVRLVADPAQVDTWLMGMLGDEPLRSAPDDLLVQLLHSPRLFPGVEVTDSIRVASSAAEGVQRRLIADLAEADRPVGRRLAGVVEAHGAADPFDSPLARSVARILARQGRVAAAISMLSWVIDTQREQLGAHPDALTTTMLASLRDGTLSGHAPAPTTSPAAWWSDPPSSDEQAPDASGPNRSADEQPIDAASPEVPAAPSPGAAISGGLPGDARLGDRLSSVDVPSAGEDQPLVDRPSVMAALRPLLRVSPGRPTTVVLEGATGVGTSTVLREAVAVLDGHGVASVVIEPIAGRPYPYAEFTAALPEIAPSVAEVLADRSLSGAARRSRLWSLLAESIEARAGGRPLALVVDEITSFDRRSRAFLDHLRRSESSSGLLVIMSAAPATDGRPAVVGDAHTTVVPVGPMTVAEVEQLLALRAPTITAERRGRAAEIVHRASGGLPGIAVALAIALDPVTLEFDFEVAVDAGDNVRRMVASRLGRPTRIVGAAAAAIGDPFDLTTLATLLGAGVEDVLDDLEQLMDAGAVVECPTPDLFAFEHVLVREALSRSVSMARRRRWAVRLSEIVTDPHDRTDHLLVAGPVASSSMVAEALLRSARAYAASDDHPEAVERFRTVTTEIGIELKTDDRITFAACLARAGAHAEAAGERRSIVRSAIDRGDPATALAAAIAELPEAEIPGSEDHRLDDLARVIDLVAPAACDGGSPEGCQPTSGSVDRIARDPSFWIARLAAYGGRHDEARAAVARLERLGGDPVERIETLLLWRSLESSSPPDERRRRLAAIDEHSIDPARRCRLLHYELVDRCELGDLDGAEDALERLEHTASTIDDPLRRYHARLGRSMLAQLAGDTDGWVNGNREAARMADRAGIPIGVVVERAQSTLLAWWTGTAPTGPTPPVDWSVASLQIAGQALGWFQRGDDDTALALGRHALAELVRTPSPVWLSEALLIADVVGALGSADERAQLLGLLDGRATPPSSVVLGACLGNLGPVDRARARLVDDPERAADLHAAARRQAAAWGMPGWVERLDRDDRRSAGVG